MVEWNTVGGLERPIENVTAGGMKGCMEDRNCECELAKVDRLEGNAPMSCGGSGA